jgi:hypothetical protein
MRADSAKEGDAPWLGAQRRRRQAMRAEEILQNRLQASEKCERANLDTLARPHIGRRGRVVERGGRQTASLAVNSGSRKRG